MHGLDCVGRGLSAHLPLHMARFKSFVFTFDGKNQRQWVRHAIKKSEWIRVYVHTIMYMPIEPSESIEAFMIHG